MTNHFIDTLHSFQFPNKYKKLIEDPWTDHAIVFVPILKHFKVKNFLELGLGKGSEVFIDYCDHVTSIEMIVEPENIEWINYCKTKFSTAKNWLPIEYQCNELLLKAHSIAWRSHNPINYLDEYLAYLSKEVHTFCLKKEYDLVFVDCGFAARADLINAFFSKVPIIVSHDTKHDHNMYGWNRINVLEGYEELKLNTPQGLTFWIEKSHKEWIKFIKLFFAQLLV